jgi:Flp pilus assembly protein TadD
MRPSMARWAAWLLPAALAAALVSGGCAAFTFKTPDPGPQARVLTGVPVRSFGLKSCGAGSLSAVLSYHGQPVTLEELDAVLPKGRNEGVVTLDMVLEARRRGYDARLVEGTPELVERELREGRPVILMLQVLDAPGQRRDLFHYIVIDGIDPAKGLVRVQLGDEKLRWTTFERLDRRWRATRRATLLIAPGGPGTRTAARNSLRYSVALEDAGRAAEAVPLYRGLLEDDPGSALLWTNLGNAEAGRGEAALAEAAYRRALEIDPAHADALNNLAWLLLQQQGGRLGEAEELARRAVASGGPDPYLALDTLGRVLRARGRCQEAVEVFTQALAVAPAAAGLALPNCPE